MLRGVMGLYSLKIKLVSSRGEEYTQSQATKLPCVSASQLGMLQVYHDLPPIQ